MPIYHKVAQGEHVVRIAAQYGFADFHALWDYPANAQLKQKRQNPNVLFPGDILVIPDKRDKQESRGTSRRHEFQTPGDTILLRLVLENIYEQPRADTPCVLKTGNQSFTKTTDGHGKIEQEIPIAAETAQLIVDDETMPDNKLILHLRVGHLDPVTEKTGQIARLNNLGYNAGPLPETSADAPAGSNGAPAGGPNETTGYDRFKSAMEEFQCDHHLHVDGKCGTQTQAKLVQVHGS